MTVGVIRISLVQVFIVIRSHAMKSIEIWKTKNKRDQKTRPDPKSPEKESKKRKRVL